MEAPNLRISIEWQTPEYQYVINKIVVAEDKEEFSKEIAKTAKDIVTSIGGKTLNKQGNERKEEETK